MRNRKKVIFIGSFVFFLGNMLPSFGNNKVNFLFPEIQNLPPKNEHSVKRKEFSQKIETLLKSTQNPAYLTVLGMAGMGKTQLAKEYAHTVSGNYNIVWWVDANQDILSQIRELGQKLYLLKECSMPNLKEKSQEKWLEAISQCYTSYFPKTLFIIDDVKEKESVQPLIEGLKNAHIIFTSRNQLMDGKTVTLKSFTREESIEYLSKLLRDFPRSSLNELAETLNDYPLALAQASAYISLFPSLTVNEYIGLYKEKRKLLWKEEEQFISQQSKGPTALEDYHHTVSSTFTLLLEQVQKIHPQAFKLLKFVSFMGSQDIPKQLLKSWMLDNQKEDDFDFHKALSTLIKLSIFEKSESSASLFNIHELLQEFVRESLSEVERDAYLEDMVSFFTTLLPNSSYQLWNLLFKDRYLEFHVNSLLKVVDHYTFKSDQLLELKIKYFHFIHFHKNDYKTVSKKISQIEKEVSNSKKLQQLEKARFLVLCANFKAIGANADEAIHLSEMAEELLTKLHSPEAKEELFFLLVNNLMDYYDYKGDTKRAEAAGKKAETLLPYINNEDYITLYYLIRATQLSNKGDYKNALNHIEISIEKSPRDMPPYLLLFKQVIKAEILTRLGELEKALALAKESHKNLRKIYLNEVNYKILRTELALAFILLKQGKLNEASQFITSTQEGLREFYKKPYESPLQAFPHIIQGEIHEAQHDLIKALEEYKKAEEVYTHIFRTVEVDDISYLYKNLIILGEKMNHDFLSKHYLERLIEHFGLDHTRTIESLQYLDKHKRSVL